MKPTSNTQHMSLHNWTDTVDKFWHFRIKTASIYVRGQYEGTLNITTFHNRQHSDYTLILKDHTQPKLTWLKKHFESLPDLCSWLREHFDDQRAAQLLL